MRLSLKSSVSQEKRAHILIDVQMFLYHGIQISIHGCNHRPFLLPLRSKKTGGFPKI